MRILGIDPGAQGGLCFLDEDGACAMPMPMLDTKELDHRKILGECMGARAQLAVIERVHAMPKQGVSSMFTFGKHYGTIIGLILAQGIRLEYVTPQAWKKVVLAGAPKGKESAVVYCAQAFPEVDLLATPKSKKPHDGMADAVCIAEYGRRTYRS